MKKVVKQKPQNRPMVECELTRIRSTKLTEQICSMKHKQHTEFVQSPQYTDTNIHL